MSRVGSPNLVNTGSKQKAGVKSSIYVQAISLKQPDENNQGRLPIIANKKRHLRHRYNLLPVELILDNGEKVVLSQSPAEIREIVKRIVVGAANRGMPFFTKSNFRRIPARRGYVGHQDVIIKEIFQYYLLKNAKIDIDDYWHKISIKATPKPRSVAVRKSDKTKIDNFQNPITIQKERIEDIAKMIELPNPNFKITHGEVRNERAELVHKFSLIGRLMKGNFEKNEIIVADDQEIIDQFNSLNPEEQQAEFEKLKAGYFSIL